MFGLGDDDQKDDTATDAVPTEGTTAEEATPAEGEAPATSETEAPAEGGEQSTDTPTEPTV